ncbi:MAG: efflux RND transporter permease subunit [Nannocystaceae bacterium]
MSRFFIDRPIFAWVLAIIVMLAGALGLVSLPVAQYPAIAPPTIAINANYPGASAKTLEDTVTQVIEQKLSGLDGLRSVASSSDGTGNAQITVTFEPETDPDIAQVQVQNKLQLAMPQLPQEVQRQGVRVVKSASNFLVIAAFVSEDGSMSRNDIADYLVSSIQDPVSRVPGVGEVQAFGSQYAMRVWLDPARLLSYGLTILDITTALQAQNAQVSAGQFGGLPAVPGQQLNATITAQTRLQTAEEFEQVLLRVTPEGAEVRLRDVARIELAGESFDIESFYNGKPTAAMGIRLASGANALDTAEAIRGRLAELEPYFPAGLRTVYPVDSTPFVRLSIEEVVKTLLEAIGLVFLVMLLFLQNVRATLIPTIAVPVVLLGTFGVLAAAGYSVNTLTMFGMVLAIGLLVDDAIVVVENVERIMSDEGLSPREATRRSMGQISGALVGIALVLATVFIPMAFFGGSVGVIYRQFSMTIVASMALSVLVALILTPALCATLLRPGHGPKTRGFFGLFNRGYAALGRLYERAVTGLVRRRIAAMLVFVGLSATMAVLFLRMPTGFLPEEDQGAINVQVLLPPGQTMERTRAVLDRVGDFFLHDEGEAVESVLTISGFSFGGRGQNSGIVFIRLRDWEERHDPRLRASAVVGRAMAAFSQVKEASIFALVPPSIRELGNASGFQLQLEDRGGLGHEALMAARDQLLALAREDPALRAVRQGGLEDTPQYKVEVDRERAAALGLALADINATLSAAWGGVYVNDFIDRGRTKRVYMQGDAPYRMQPDDIDRWYVRNREGEMVPFSAFATGRWTFGSQARSLRRLPDDLIREQAGPRARLRRGDGGARADRRPAPRDIGFEVVGLSYEEKVAGAGAGSLYALSLLVVFLCLAALYESWSIPVAVLLCAPLGVLGAVVATPSPAALANDVYFQVGLLSRSASAKNAI